MLEFIRISPENVDLIKKIDLEIFNDPFPDEFYRWLVETYPELQMGLGVRSNILSYMLNMIENGNEYVDFPVIHLLRFGTKEKVRRLKLANNLLKLLCMLSEQKGIPVLLEVKIDNYPAQNAYKKFGFEIIGFRKDYYGPEQHAYIMLRRIK